MCTTHVIIVWLYFQPPHNIVQTMTEEPLGGQHFDIQELKHYVLSVFNDITMDLDKKNAEMKDKTTELAGIRTGLRDILDIHRNRIAEIVEEVRARPDAKDLTGIKASTLPIPV